MIVISTVGTKTLFLKVLWLLMVDATALPSIQSIVTMSNMQVSSSPLFALN